MRLLACLLVFGCNSSLPSTSLDMAMPDLAPFAPLVTPLACTDAIADVYVAPANLPAFSPSERGRIVRCAIDANLSAQMIEDRARAAGYVGGALSSGAQALRIAYRTERLDGQPGIGVAEVYLPSAPARLPAPAAVAAHGTIGLADLCAPTRLGGIGTDSMSMPLVGRGVAVIAPDYAGLGNGGGMDWHGYDIAADEAHSVLDAVRALKSAAPAGTLTDGVVLLGHSQGGGSVLASQALARSYAPELTIAGVVGIAPTWFDRRVWIQVLSSSARDIPTGGVLQFRTAISAMYFFAHAAVYDGADHALDPFAAAVRDGVGQAIRTGCVDTLGALLANVAPTYGDLYDHAFGDSLEKCAAGTCDAVGTKWLERMTADTPALDAAGGPVLLVQGLADTLVTPISTACVKKRITGDGAQVRACTDPAADHLTIPGHQAELVFAWLEARLFGTADPSCDDALPACP